MRSLGHPGIFACNRMSIIIQKTDQKLPEASNPCPFITNTLQDFITNTKGCIDAVMPHFARCARGWAPGGQPALPENMLNIPFFHALLSRPSPDMANELAEIRERLSLPIIKSTANPSGLSDLGLRTPGVYILALHFRRQPKQFENFELMG